MTRNQDSAKEIYSVHVNIPPQVGEIPHRQLETWVSEINLGDIHAEELVKQGNQFFLHK
jgi:hypothetical protein